MSRRFAAITLVLSAALAGVPADAQDLAAPGLIVSQSEVVFSSQVAARIVEFPFREGESFARGDRLVGFDCARFEAERREAQGAVGAADARLRVNRELDKYGAVGRGDLDISQADADAAKARAASLDEVVASCAIDAPFSGRVVETFVNLHETPGQGDPLLSILDDRNLQLEIIAPSDWLRWLEPGRTMTFEVRETGALLNATVTRLGASVDPVSQSINVVAALPEVGPGVLPGMSGRAIFADPEG